MMHLLLLPSRTTTIIYHPRVVSIRRPLVVSSRGCVAVSNQDGFDFLELVSMAILRGDRTIMRSFLAFLRWSCPSLRGLGERKPQAIGERHLLASAMVAMLHTTPANTWQATP